MNVVDYDHSIRARLQAAEIAANLAHAEFLPDAAAAELSTAARKIARQMPVDMATELLEPVAISTRRKWWAATELREAASKLNGKLPMHADDDEIQQWSMIRARWCRNIQQPPEIATAIAGAIAVDQGVPPIDTEKTAPAAAMRRYGCPAWWGRQGRKHAMRHAEQICRARGLVSAKASAYCSEYTAQRWRDARRRTAKWLDEYDAINKDTGEVVKLADAMASSVANPENRRHELMTRIRGIEECATTADWRGMFVTITAPSRFHAINSAGKPVSNYDGSDPRAVQDYFCKLWAHIRADAKKHGIRMVGLRVVEPHHDGTPHWHLLLWTNPDTRTALYQMLRRYALRDTPGERGAKQHRCKVEHIDPAKGSAAGYIAKYVAKNIDGAHVGNAHLRGDDLSTAGERPAPDAAERITAWASCWGIRQFQFFGAAPVTLWRELRRVDHCADNLLERARAAADAGQWADYQGVFGIVYEREGRPLDPVLAQTGISYYDRTPVFRVCGVASAAAWIITRSERWELVKRSEAERLGLVGITVTPNQKHSAIPPPDPGDTREPAPIFATDAETQLLKAWKSTPKPTAEQIAAARRGVTIN